MRSEFALISTAFSLLPTLSGNGGAVVMINAGGTAMTVSPVVGTGSVVLAISPALTGTPTAPTQTSLTNNNSLATTAYADRAASNGLVTATGSTTARTLSDRFSDIYNVLDYGASATASATVNVTAIQAAADEAGITGGIIFLPPGKYNINAPILQTSNTKFLGYGATLCPVAVGSWASSIVYPCIQNKNYSATTLTDHDLEVEGLRFDYSVMGDYGGTHAIRYFAAQRVRVVNTYCTAANDHTYFIGCDDTLCLGCISDTMNNCCHDHSAIPTRGPSNARVIGCYCGGTGGVGSGAGVFFNAGDGSGTDSNTAQTLIVSDCIMFGSGIGLDTMGSNNVANDITITNNWISGSIIARGALNNTNVSGNTFLSGLASEPVIWIDQGAGAGTGYTGNPSGTQIVGNTIRSPNTSLGSEAVIRLYGGGIVSANQVQPGPGTFSYALQILGGIYYGGNNNLVAGAGGAINGTIYADSALTLPNGGFGFQQADASGTFVRLVTDSSNNTSMYGTNASGVDQPIWQFANRTNSPLFNVHWPILTNGGAAISSGASAPTSSTQGSGNGASFYGDTATAIGYLSSGTASWNEIVTSASASSTKNVTSAVAPNSTSVFTMQGLAGSITPAITGRIELTIWGTIVSTVTTAGTGIALILSYGAGTAPTSNAALTGTQLGQDLIFELPATAAATNYVRQPFSMNYIVTGLTVGSPYWLDLAAEALGAAGDVSLTNICIVAREF